MRRGTTLAACEPLAWENTESDSYERTQNAGTIVRQIGRFAFDVALTDSETRHTVLFGEDWHGEVGACDCQGWEFDRPDPCAHLWALHLAAGHGVADVSHVCEALAADTPTECPLCGTDDPEVAHD